MSKHGRAIHFYQEIRTICSPEVNTVWLSFLPALFWSRYQTQQRTGYLSCGTYCNYRIRKLCDCWMVKTMWSAYLQSHTLMSLGAHTSNLTSPQWQPPACFTFSMPGQSDDDPLPYLLLLCYTCTILLNLDWSSSDVSISNINIILYLWDTKLILPPIHKPSIKLIL